LARALREPIELADVDQGYAGVRAAEASRVHGIELEIIEFPKPSGVSWSITACRVQK
jgi:hypothetical protein